MRMQSPQNLLVKKYHAGSNIKKIQLLPLTFKEEITCNAKSNRFAKIWYMLAQVISVWIKTLRGAHFNEGGEGGGR